MRARKYTYIPNAEIESITTWNGKEIPGSKLLDGAYARGKVQYGDGGVTKKTYLHIAKKEASETFPLINDGYYVKVSVFKESNLGGQILEDGMTKEEAINFAKDLMNRWNLTPNNIIVAENLSMADGGMMAKGGGVDKNWVIKFHQNQSSGNFSTTIEVKAKNESDAINKGFMELTNMGEDSDEYFVENIYTIKYADGGMMAKGGEIPYKKGDTLVASLSGIKYKVTGVTKNETELLDSELLNLTTVKTEYILNSILKNQMVVEKRDMAAEGGMMARGGYASRHRKRTLEEKAQEMYGSDWFDLDERTRKELIDDLRITKGEKGLIVGDKYVATFTLDNGEAITKTYNTKDELDEGIGEMYSDYDVIDVKIEETKVKEEPKEEKKGIFKLAKITEKTTSKGKEKRQGVAIEGIESDISRYEELKAIMKNAKAESDLIGGRIKELGSQKWLELYEQSGTNPNSIDLIDGDENIMLQVKDGYKKVEPEKRAILQENYPDLLETTIVYTMDTALLDKYGEVITNLINNSKDIEEKDKDKLVKGESTTTIKKGSIDKILNYPNPEEVFILIEPTMALY